MVLTNSQNYNRSHQPAEGMPSCVFQGLVATKSEQDSFEAWIGTLTKLAEMHEREALEREAQQRPVPDSAVAILLDGGPGSPSREYKLPLEKVPEGPWRSLGGYFDYSLWPERERFLELDKAIAAGIELRDGRVEHDIEMV